MKRSIFRRDFLKLAGVGFGTLAFRPFDLEPHYMPKPLPQFPNSEIIGRILGTTQVTNRASNDPLQASALRTLYDDNLVEWG